LRKLTYYVATTIDGYIAGRGDAVDFYVYEGDHMDAINARFPETIPGHLRQALGIDSENKGFDTVLMGRGTYDIAFKEGITSPYPHLRQIVFSSSLTERPDPAVEVISGDPVPAVQELKQQEGLDIWLCGGGKLAAQLHDEIDEILLKLHPVTIGEGVPLFDGPVGPRRFDLTDSTLFSSGVAFMTYTRR
jgi:dihydrofolate reductase